MYTIQYLNLSRVHIIDPHCIYTSSRILYIMPFLVPRLSLAFYRFTLLSILAVDHLYPTFRFLPKTQQTRNGTRHILSKVKIWIHILGDTTTPRLATPSPSAAIIPHALATPRHAPPTLYTTNQPAIFNPVIVR